MGTWIHLMNARAILLILLVSACAGGSRTTNCGIVGLAGPSLLLEEFARPGNTLGEVPENMPERIVARIAAGPAYSAVVGKTDTSWVIGIEGLVPEQPRPGFGVLVVDPSLGAQGLLLYEGLPIPRAPILGTVNAGSLNIPFHGLRASIAAFQDPSCILFPDSLKQ